MIPCSAAKPTVRAASRSEPGPVPAWDDEETGPAYPPQRRLAGRAEPAFTARGGSPRAAPQPEPEEEPDADYIDADEIIEEGDSIEEPVANLDYEDGEDEIVIRSEDTKLRIKRNVVVQILGADEAEAAKS